jgi:hypothetical protein
MSNEESSVSINDATIQAERTRSYPPSRVPTRRMIAVGATALVAATMMLVAFVQNSDREFVPSMQQPAPQTRDDIVQDLVDRGLVPGGALQPAPQTRDDIVQDLVDRGLVPAATLED